MLFPKPRPHVLDKQDERKRLEAEERAVRKAIALRDERRCRCCGRKDNLHLHHLTFRSRGGKWETSNIVTLDAICHALLHARQLWIFGKNADKRLTFEIDERAVVDVFGTKELPRDVRMVKAGR